MNKTAPITNNVLKQKQSILNVLFHISFDYMLANLVIREY